MAKTIEVLGWLVRKIGKGCTHQQFPAVTPPFHIGWFVLEGSENVDCEGERDIDFFVVAQNSIEKD